ncbi:endolytic transglycosylase MltG [Shimazuella sp. AN120528]|uniref:endolytic transglycosylase MltG n=1 Tax=Shimazuella soli TaxID=1892854 RepID=UPI001F0CF163|nr:endolytic transglycosylase MltG [Shimazuella soli]MCH5583659.1 endolytic transglycosylase MltG [Shimazuella soli]
MKWFLRIILTFVLLAGWIITGYYFIDWTLESPSRSKAVEIDIEPDSSLKQIGSILKSKNLIREDWFFRYYAAYRQRINLLAGSYEIKPDENLDDILNKIAIGKQDLIKVTIPEGKTVNEIANILQAKGFSKEDFLKAVNRPSNKDQFTFEQEIKKTPVRKYKLEGYLFPSTYEFHRGESGEEIVNEMVRQFAKRMNKLDARNKLINSNSKYNIDQWVTIASLIEREGRVRSELPIISGVIYNRLKINMPLQVDASIIYAYSLNGIIKKKLGHNDTKLRSPYNTYLNKGLPPGPISNPGLEALQAALDPEAHSYLFYVTKQDGTNTHFFSKTYKEQLTKIAQSNKNEKSAK